MVGAATESEGGADPGADLDRDPRLSSVCANDCIRFGGGCSIRYTGGGGKGSGGSVGVVRWEEPGELPPIERWEMGGEGVASRGNSGAVL